VNKIIALLVLVLSLSLNGCFDLNEELWINKDGSGRMKFTVGVAEPLMNMMKQSGEDADFCDALMKQESMPEESEAIESVVVLKSMEAGMNYCTIDMRLKDFRKFREARDQAIEGENDKYEFPFLIEDLSDDRVRITQDFSSLGMDDPDQDEFDRSAQQMAMAMMTPMLSGKYITVTVHAEEIESTNGVVSEDGKSTTWRKPVIELIQQKDQVHRFETIIVHEPSWMDKLKGWWDSI
jgi:hypothetical protein